VRPVRGGGHHQEHADPAKYGKFLLPHVADGHKQVAKVRPPSFPRMVKKDATTLTSLASGTGAGECGMVCGVGLRGAIARRREIARGNLTPPWD
jgi:hypothetical protein